MKYLLMVLIMSMITLTATAKQPDVRCWYTANGHICGPMEDNDPQLVAHGAECLIGKLPAKKLPREFVTPRGHMKLQVNEKVDCNLAIDGARKSAAEAGEAARVAKAVKKAESIVKLKGLTDAVVREKVTPEKMAELAEIIIDLKNSL